jgi:glucose-1-phosphate adenylyltransferase
VLQVDEQARVVGFAEKPTDPVPMPGDPGLALSSMGNYLFNSEVLVDVLKEDAHREGAHDFGRNIIPELFPQARVFAYDFARNAVPGIQPHEERGYWRDVGEMETYWQAHMDLLGESPRFDLYNPEWPILGDAFDGAPAKIVGGHVERVLLGEGCVLNGGRLVDSVLGRGVRIEPGAEIEQSVVMDFCTIGKGARLRRVIVDRFNTIPPGTDIGFDPERDQQRYFQHSSNIVVVSRGRTRFFV